MMKSFREYLSEQQDKAVAFTFGRFNPPSIGHGKLLDKLASINKNYRVFASQSHDPKKNPLAYGDKVKFMRKMFPRHARNIILEPKILNALDACSYLYSQGFVECTMVVGSDRIPEFETLLNKYNGAQGRHGFYNFKSGVKVVSAGDRDPDSDGVTGMSASKLRAAAENNDLVEFSKGMPREFKEVEQLFNFVRLGMGLRESRSFRKHVQLEKLSDKREMYIRGELFSIGDEVIIKENNDVATITYCGSNYVIVENNDGKKSRKWLDAVEKIPTLK